MMTVFAIALAFSVLTAAGFAARGSGRTLFFALLSLAFGVSCVNPMIEAVVFQLMPLRDVPLPIAAQFVLAVLLCAGITLLRGKSQNDVAPIPARLAAKLIVAGLCYTVLYVAAGTCILPFIREFYANKVLPGLGTLLPLQIARGALYVLFALPWLRLRPRHSGIVLGLVYAIPGGIALLMLPNTYMPPNIRHVHMLEVGTENFLFGLIAAWLCKPATSYFRQRDSSLPVPAQ